MDALCLQDWLTLRGAAGNTGITQPEPAWLDLYAYLDVVAWLEVKEFTPSTGVSIPAISFQSSPSKDDALFFTMAPVAQFTLGLTTTVMLRDAMPAGCPPLARWFRWNITMSGGLAWDVTFRVWLAVNRIGNRVGISDATTLAQLEGQGYQYAYGQCWPTGQTSPQTGGGNHYTPPQGGGVGTPPPWWGHRGKPPGLVGVPGSGQGVLPTPHTPPGSGDNDPPTTIKPQPPTR